MARETFYKQVVTRLYKTMYKDLKALAKSSGETEADIIRSAIEQYIARKKTGEA